jgi:hypothetical protein
MIVLSDSNGNVIGSFVDGTTVTNLSGVTALPSPEQQVGKNAVLVIDPVTSALSYNYVDRPLTDAELAQQNAAENAVIQSNQANILFALAMGGLI